ncbi:efflux RND transporter permease subunit [Aminipila sp.]|uniref:efflux RND transporter permease subunit n=1 Tax=Aminipila sp. TaxID=2060095 RepID=UPI00289AD31B|nr:efflux RND transporter permease subunit [Aminipila sp.]
MFLTDISLKRPVLATVCIIALLAMGVISFFGLGSDEFPPAEFPYVTVTIVQPGASPDQIEDNITKKVEDAIGQVAGLKHINSTCQENASIIYAEFTLETPVADAVQNVRDKIGTIRSSLPSDCEEPIIASYDPTSQPVVSLAITGKASIREMTTTVNDLIKPKLETISGVGSVKIYGAEEREIHINLNRDKVALYGLTTNEIVTSLKSTNMEASAGQITQGDNQFSLQTSGLLTKLDQFNQLVISRQSGQPIYLQDVAEIEDGAEEKDSIAYYQGKEAIGIDIIKQSGVSTIEVADQILEKCQSIQEDLPSNIQLEVVKDNSIIIEDSVDDVLKTIVEGAVLAVLIVLLFLGNWRTTLISAIALPTSIIGVFVLMKILNFTLNTMTLTALSLSVGLLIDDAIVVIENIERHRHMGKDALTATKEGTSEIGLAVIATTLALVAVFLPVGMLNGVVGQFFKQFGITVVGSVLISLFVSFTLVPMLSSRYLKDETGEDKKPKIKMVLWIKEKLNWFNQKFDYLSDRYSSLLKIVFKHKVKLILCTILLFVGSMFIAANMGTDFIPKSDLAKMNIVIEPDAGQTKEAIGNKIQLVDKAIRKNAEVTKVYATVQDDSANLYVELTERNLRHKSMEVLSQEIRGSLKEIPGIRASVTPVSLGPTGDVKDIEFNIVGDDITTLQKYGEKAQKVLEELPGVVDVVSSYKPGSPQTSIKINQEKAADLGVESAQVVDALYTLYNGVVVNQFKEGQEQSDIRVRLQKSDRENIDNLNCIYLKSSTSGELIPLTAISQKVFDPSPSIITRYDKQQRVSISANVQGFSTGEINTIFLSKLNKEAPLPEGCEIVSGDMTELMDESITSMLFALLMAVMFIIFIMAAQFESYIDPLSVILSLPLAVIGAVFGLWIMGSNINLISLIGMIMLMGLVTKNAILLIDFARNEMKNGIPCNEALILAGKTRLRPIIMTTLAMILGMIPMAMGDGTGGETRAPMAYAIIGGLISSTFLTLFVIPVIYSMIQELKSRIHKVMK